MHSNKLFFGYKNLARSRYMKSIARFPAIRSLLSACALALSLQPTAQAAEAPPAEVHLDYAYYSPVSLVLKHFGFLGESPAADQGQPGAEPGQ
jgi:hypothetical protein